MSDPRDLVAAAAAGERSGSPGDHPGATSLIAVELRDVTKAYERGFHALDGIDLRIARGEFVAITGPSGCGKSTMLHLIAALDSPTSGSVMVDGHDLRTHRNISEYRRNHVGLVFQLHNLLASQPIVANVQAVMFGSGATSTERRARAGDLLAQVDLAGREHRLPTQLSGGERQRVAVARALANRPQLLLADEPTGSLDSASAARILDLFKRVHESGVTIVLVTHDLSIAAQADRTVHVRDGKTTDPPTDPL
ncbi:MAG: ABC transporter ATP-binding protein [Acidobacteriota bacterium]|nr:ABC transporter ATP-binding protein [Acidobacteriota bacterium]